MKNNKKVTEDVLFDGLDAEIPEEAKSLEYPQKVVKAMSEWADKDKENRSFVMICSAEGDENDKNRLSAVGFQGNASVISRPIVRSVEMNEDFREAFEDAVAELCRKYGV